MEAWQLDFEWLKVRTFVKDSMGQENLPDLNAVLMLIGIQEVGRWKQKFTKEEKQELIHVAVCVLLSFDGHYAFEGRDEDGWPHFKLKKPINFSDVKSQELLLKRKIVQYFEEREQLYHELEEE